MWTDCAGYIYGGMYVRHVESIEAALWRDK